MGATPVVAHVMGWRSQQYGSFERFVVALTRRCAELGARSHLVFHEPPASARFVADVEAEIHVVPEARQVGDPRHLLRLGRILRRIGTTHLHAHFGYDAYNALALGRLLGIERRFTTKHITPSTSLRDLSALRHRWLARQVEVVWAVSAWVADHLLRLGVPASRVEVCYLGVDPVAYAPDPRLRARMRRELGLADGTRAILSTSHLRPGKGTELLPRLVAELRRDGDDVVLLAAGGGPLGDRLRTEATQLGLDERVFRLLGVREDVPALLAAADLFIFPTVEKEGMGLGALEALAAAVPVAAMAVSDLATLPADAAAVVPKGDAAALTAAARQLLDDPAAAARMAARGREVAIERFSIDHAVDVHVGRYFAPRRPA